MQCNRSNYFLYNVSTKVDSVNVFIHLLGSCGYTYVYIFILSYIAHNWERKKLTHSQTKAEGKCTCPLPQHVVCDNHVTLWAG